jgi:integrase
MQNLAKKQSQANWQLTPHCDIHDDTQTQLTLFDLPTSQPINNPEAQIIQFPNPTTTPQPKRTKYPQQRVSPIRDPEKVNAIYQSLLNSGRHGLRNATIFALQLKIGRRTNDIARMTVGDVYDFKLNRIKPTITVDEHKTGKTARDLPLDDRIRARLFEYVRSLKESNPDSLLFPSQKRNKDGSQRPLNTASLDDIYQRYTSKCFSDDDQQTHISTYAARKTYGYNIYSECNKNHNGFVPGTDINALQYVQSVFNHNSSMTTLRYIGAYDTVAPELANDIAEKYDF